MQQRLETGFSRYEQIAIDIAQKIVRGEFRVGQKLSGRSLLAGTYNVSPETIRRSIAILQNIGVVESVTGSGIVIKSKSLAEEYLKEFNERMEVMHIRNHIGELLFQRRNLDVELEKELNRLLDYSFQKISILQQIEEAVVPGDSWVVGETIAKSNIRQQTGATIVAINRHGEEIFSPSPDFVLQGEDILTLVGASGTKDRVRDLFRIRTNEVK